MKKVLFIVAALILSLALAACDEGEQPATNDNETEAAETNNDDVAEDNGDIVDEEEDTSSGNYQLGDTAEVDGIKFTVKSVSTTDERNEFEEEDPNIVVKIEYEIENGSDEEIPIGMDLQVYDGTGNRVDSYPLDNTMGSLQPGKKIQGVEHYGIEEGPIEVYFQPAFSFEDPAIFELEV